MKTTFRCLDSDSTLLARQGRNHESLLCVDTSSLLQIAKLFETLFPFTYTLDRTSSILMTEGYVTK